MTALPLSLGACSTVSRYDADDLVLGRTSTDRLEEIYGRLPPGQEFGRNGLSFRTYRFLQLMTTSTPRVLGISAARIRFLTVFDGQLVAKDYSSSLASDHTDFDEAKLARIQKGLSRRSDIETLFGPSTGTAIYPYTKEKGQTALLYRYSQVSSDFTGSWAFDKSLIITLDTSDLVIDFEYFASGRR